MGKKSQKRVTGKTYAQRVKTAQNAGIFFRIKQPKKENTQKGRIANTSRGGTKR